MTDINQNKEKRKKARSAFLKFHKKLSSVCGTFENIDEFNVVPGIYIKERLKKSCKGQTWMWSRNTSTSIPRAGIQSLKR